MSKHLTHLRTVSDDSAEDGAVPRMPWRQVLDNIDTSIRSYGDQWTMSGGTLAGAIASARSLVELAADRVGESPEQVEVVEVLREIASDIIAKNEDELLDDFEQLNQSAFRLAGECVKQFGGKVAKKRWAKCAPATLEFEERYELKCLVPRTVTDRSEIRIQVGDKPYSLYSYLTLEYQLFHEYISHIFAAWDTKRGMLSEGDLAALEQWTYPQLVHGGLPVLLLKKRERAFVVDAGGKMGEWWEWQEEMMEDVRGHWVPQDRLTQLLLDLAGTEPSPEMPQTALERTLLLLHYPSKMAHKWPVKKSLEVKALLASDVDLGELAGRLRDHCYPGKLLGDR